MYQYFREMVSQEKTQESPKWKDAQALKNAVDEWSKRINVQVQQIQLRPMKRKWASISITTGRLTLNTELLDLPKELGEFVIVHELVHLLVPNHGKVFKCFLSAYLPDWGQRERKLRELSKQGSRGAGEMGEMRKNNN